jgi:hypothetical protein
MASVCSSFVKSTGRPCCRHVIDFSSHCGYHVPNKKQRTFRQPKPLEECAICYTNMLHSQPRQTCGHRFHDRCIVRWFQTVHHTCPLCRSVLSEDTLSDNEHDPTYTPDTPVHNVAAGAVHNVAAGAVQGSAHVAVHNVAAGAVQGSAHGAVHNVAAGAVHNVAAGAVQGSAHGAVQGSAHGAVHNVAAGGAHGAVVSGAAGGVQGEEGSSLHNPILIEDDDVHEDVLGVNFVPDTPPLHQQRLPTPRRIVFDDQDHLNTIIHNAIDQRLRLLFP